MEFYSERDPENFSVVSFYIYIYIYIYIRRLQYKFVFVFIKTGNLSIKAMLFFYCQS